MSSNGSQNRHGLADSKSKLVTCGVIGAWPQQVDAFHLAGGRCLDERARFHDLDRGVDLVVSADGERMSSATAVGSGR